MTDRCCPDCEAPLVAAEYECGARTVRTGPNTCRTTPCGDRGRIKTTGQIALPLARPDAGPERTNEARPRRTR